MSDFGRTFFGKILDLRPMDSGDNPKELDPDGSWIPFTGTLGEI